MGPLIDGDRESSAWRIAFGVLLFALSCAAAPYILLVAFVPELLSLPRAAVFFDHREMPTGELLDVLTSGMRPIAAAIVCLLPVSAIGLAARARPRNILAAACLVGLLAGAVLCWKDGSIYARPAATAAAATAGFGFVCSFRKLRTTAVACASAYLFLLVPSLFALSAAPSCPSAARKLWTAHVQPDSIGSTSSEYTATRVLAFAGGRLIVKLPDALIALDAATGTVAARKQLLQSRFVEPPLYATHSGNLLTLAAGQLLLLNSDLSVLRSAPLDANGELGNVSADGRAVTWFAFAASAKTIPPNPAAAASYEVLDAETLEPILRFPYSGPYYSIAPDALLDQSAGETILHTMDGPHRIAAGDCAEARLLSSTRILLYGCGELRVLDFRDRILVRAPLARSDWQVAGMAQDGSRFALVHGRSTGDPSRMLFEHFVIFSADTCRPLAMVRSEQLPERISWSTMSPDGKWFAAGTPSALSLYRIP